ncbi:hypothetical protein ACLBPK_05925, partial [Klebsiella pneumoniae]
MNDLPVVRSPWRILILVLGFTFLYETPSPGSWLACGWPSAPIA